MSEPTQEQVSAAREWLEADWLDSVEDPGYQARAIKGLAALLCAREADLLARLGRAEGLVEDMGNLLDGADEYHSPGGPRSEWHDRRDAAMEAWEALSPSKPDATSGGEG